MTSIFKLHEQPKRVLAPIVIDERFEDEYRSTIGHAVVGLAKELSFLLAAPVVNDMTERDDVRLGKRFGEHVSGMERQSVRETVIFDVAGEDGLDPGRDRTRGL